MREQTAGRGKLWSKGKEIGPVTYSIIIVAGERGSATLEGERDILSKALEERDAELQLDSGEKAPIIITNLAPFPRNSANCKINGAFEA